MGIAFTKPVVNCCRHHAGGEPGNEARYREYGFIPLFGVSNNVTFIQYAVVPVDGSVEKYY